MCTACLADPPPYEAVVIWGEYDGVLRQAILALKHRGFDQLAPVLAGRLAARVALEKWSEDIDLIAAVPTHPLHRVRRGFAAAGMLANVVGSRLNKPVRTVLRKRGVGRQAGMTRSRRLRLAGRRFFLRPGVRLLGRRVLLIDDVTTTGTTLRRAAETLTRGGVAAVYCAALAWVPDPRRTG
jgi:predicted amidophosphoribosyltransferase